MAQDDSQHIIPFPRPSAAQTMTRLERQDVRFERQELQIILNLYGRMVAAGELRDYSIDFTPAYAAFNLYRRTSEAPLYRVMKDPKCARKQSLYAVIAQSGHILKRGSDLAQVLKCLEKRPKLTVL